MVGPRIAQARKRLIEANEFIPIEHLVALNRPRFRGDQGGGDIYLHYAESMALAVFLMQADGGRHREGFLDYVRDAYKGRFRGGSGRPLEDRLGIRYPRAEPGVPATTSSRGPARGTPAGRRHAVAGDAGPAGRSGRVRAVRPAHSPT